jgi:hypothetical protein
MPVLADGGIVGGDNVVLSGTAVGTFAGGSVGFGKPVTVSGLALSGSLAVNYNLLPVLGLSADVTLRAVSVDGVSAASKVYDGNNVVDLVGQARAVGLVDGDAVSFVTTNVGTLADANVGTSKPVTVTGFSLSGLSASNYSLQQPGTLTASVSPRPLTVGGLSVLPRTFNNDGTVVLSGTARLVGLVPGDNIQLAGNAVASFASVSAGTAKAVTVSGYTLSGTGLNNYVFTQPTGLSGDVLPSTQTINFGSLQSKTYGDAADCADAYGQLRIARGTECGDWIVGCCA